MSLGISAAVQRLPSNRRAGDGYSVLGMSPKLAFDFDSEYYRTNGGQKSFSNAMTFARAGLATMVDSDGLIKWAPHNLLLYSEDFSQWTTNFNTQLVSTDNQDPSGGNSAARISSSGGASSFYRTVFTEADTDYTISFFVKSAGQGSDTFRLFFDGSLISTDITATNEWVLYTFENSSNGGTNACGITRDSLDSAFDILIYAPHLYRSDLGGMVNNPDRGDSYVPTTSSAVYLPRRGHHKYNGDQWVNKGILAESEARTNLQQNSQDDTLWTGVQLGKSLVFNSLTGNVDSVLAVPNTTSALHYLSIPFSAPAPNSVHTASIIAKANGYSWISIEFLGYTGYVGVGKFNLTDGTASIGARINPTSTIQATIEKMGEYYRCAVSCTMDDNTSPTNTPRLNVLIDDEGSTWGNWSGDGTSGVCFYGVQVEAGSTPSSYIPTNGSSVTRAAEAVTVPYANLPYSSIAMSIAMMGELDYADEDSAETAGFYKWEKSTGNYIISRLDTRTTDTGQVQFIQGINSVIDLVQTSETLYSSGLNVPFNISSRNGSTFINGAADGVALTANTTPTALVDLSATDLIVAYNFNGTISEFRIWDRDIGDTGIAEATKPSTEPSLSLTFDGQPSSFTNTGLTV